MSKEEILLKLNGDLSNEYKHMHFYLKSSFLIEGIHRIEVSEFLVEQAKSEFEHVQQFAKLIIGLEGVPTNKIADYPFLTDVIEILEYALTMEEEVVNNYLERMEDAQSLGGVDGKWIELFLEDQLISSREDIDELRQITRNIV